MDADISVPIERLQIQGNISVFNLTSRLSASEGLIAVGVDVIGWFGLPSRNTEIEALTSEGVPLATSRTGANGTAMFTTLKLQEYPGMYDIYFRPKGQSDVAAKLIVNITGCPIGNVKADTGKACIRCTRGYYSFNPENTTCDVCPANAGECCAVRCGCSNSRAQRVLWQPAAYGGFSNEMLVCKTATTEHTVSIECTQSVTPRLLHPNLADIFACPPCRVPWTREGSASDWLLVFQ